MKQRLLQLVSSLLVLSILACTNLNAQSSSFNDIKKVKLRNMGPIIKDNVVQGYYMFYLYDKVSKGNRMYKLQLLDANLDKIATKTITAGKYLILQSASYNNEEIMLKFLDVKTKIVSFRRYDATGDYKGQKTYTLENRYELALFDQGDGDLENITLFPADGNGFVDYHTTKGKKFGYEINFYPSNSEIKSWKKAMDPNSKYTEAAMFLAANDEMVVSTIAKRKNALSKDPEYFIQGLDINTGKELFEKTLEDNKYALQVISGFKNETTGNVEVTGFYYGKDDKTFKAASKGVFFFVLDNKGDPISRKYISWKADVSKVLPSNDRGKLNDIGYMFFHRVIRTKDGKIFAIAEQYNKVADGMGIAAMALSSGDTGSATKLAVENFYIFEFDKDFNLVDVEVVEKFKSSFSFPNAAYSFLSPQIMAQVANTYGGFDYLFTQNYADRPMFMVGYLDYERRKKEKNMIVFGAATHDGEEYTTDKINLDTKKGEYIRVMQGKPGHILISEYIAKEKRMEFRLEKINF